MGTLGRPLLSGKGLTREQFGAIAISIALNAAALWFVAQHTGIPLPPAANEELVTELVFIERLQDTVPTIPDPQEVTRSPTEPRPAVPQPSKRMRVSPVQATAVAHDGGESAGISGRPTLDLSVSESAPLVFERNPLARRVPLPESPERTRFVFTDRTLGGVMRSMTKASVCRDLRTALSASPANAEDLIAEMKAYGCKV